MATSTKHPTPHPSARQRILDAAMTRIASDGIAATQIKQIAADVGVSPALVIHHFGSKDDLRRACDEYLVSEIRRRKSEALANQQGFDPLQAIRDVSDGPPLQRYLARTLADGSPHVASLIDEMVQDALVYVDGGVRSGLLKPTEDMRSRIVVITMWSLGALMLHEHIERLMGIDILDGTQGWAAWMRPSMEILAKGAIDESMYDLWRTAVDTYDAEHKE